MSDPTSLAERFRKLAEDFDFYRRTDAKVMHLSVNIQGLAIQAGRLIHEAGTAGLFRDDPAWQNGRQGLPLPHRVEQNGKSVTLCYEGGAGIGAPPADAPLVPAWFRWLLTFTVGRLVKRYASKFREDAGCFDLPALAKDAAGHFIGKSGKPITRRWYRNGKLMPANWRGNLSDMKEGEHWESHESEAFARVTDFYDEADAFAHQRARAEVYRDACRLLAELVAGAVADAGDDDERKVPDDEDEGWLTVAELAEFVGVSESCIRNSRRKASVKTPKRGGRNHRFSRTESHAIILKGCESTTRATSANANEALAILDASKSGHEAREKRNKQTAN